MCVCVSVCISVIDVEAPSELGTAASDEGDTGVSDLWVVHCRITAGSLVR